MNPDGAFCAVCTLPHCYGNRPRAQHEEQSWSAACGDWQEIHRIHPCESQHHMKLSDLIYYIFINGKHLLIPVGNGFFSPPYSFADEGGCWDEDVVQFAAGHQFVSKDHHKRFPSGWDPFSPLFPPLHYDQREPAAPEGFSHLTTEPFRWQCCKSQFILFFKYLLAGNERMPSLTVHQVKTFFCFFIFHIVFS